MKQITVIGIGPGSQDDMTIAVRNTIANADIVVGYKFYFQFIRPLLPASAQCIGTGMKRECERAEEAFRLAEEGHHVVVMSSGDAGIYGMASLVWELKAKSNSDVQISVLPVPASDPEGRSGFSLLR